ncbi:MAG: hypothetical protein ACJ74D_02485 [Gaiellaceae bacterium]
MRRLWNRRRDDEHAADWPEPRPEFLTPLADRVRATPGQTATRRVQLALAGVLALALLVAVSAFGGVGYAARQAEQAVEAVSGPFSADSPQGTVGGSADVADNAGYGGKDKCKVLKKKFKQLKKKHVREWRALIADQRHERKSFPGRPRGNNPAWHRLLAEQRAERRALKRKQRAERRELQKAIKKCKKGRR